MSAYPKIKLLLSMQARLKEIAAMSIDQLKENKQLLYELILMQLSLHLISNRKVLLFVPSKTRKN